MRGALIFLAVFFAVLVATLAYPSMPPGPQLYSLLNVPTTDFPVLGIPATTLVIAVFNGVVYGIIAWLAFTIAQKTRK
jgi:di/tricarboxylate transporter